MSVYAISTHTSLSLPLMHTFLSPSPLTPTLTPTLNLPRSRTLPHLLLPVVSSWSRGSLVVSLQSRACHVCPPDGGVDRPSPALLVVCALGGTHHWGVSIGSHCLYLPPNRPLVLQGGVLLRHIGRCWVTRIAMPCMFVQCTYCMPWIMNTAWAIEKFKTKLQYFTAWFCFVPFVPCLLSLSAAASAAKRSKCMCACQLVSFLLAIYGYWFWIQV